MITTSSPAKPTAAIVAIAYSAVAAPVSDFHSIFYTFLYSSKQPNSKWNNRQENKRRKGRKTQWQKQ